MTTTIYVLMCFGEHYYVGKTKRLPETRIVEHFSGIGSEWTKMYPPVAVVETIHEADDFDEDKYTKQYMLKYGIDNVRGGSYTQINLPEYQMEALKKELCTATDRCYRSGMLGHVIAQCTPINNVSIDDFFVALGSDPAKWDIVCDKQRLTEIAKSGRRSRIIDKVVFGNVTSVGLSRSGLAGRKLCIKELVFDGSTPQQISDLYCQIMSVSSS